MIAPLDNSWKEKLKDELNTDYFKDLEAFIIQEYKQNECFPTQSKIFAALNNCLFKDIKVVILGQDPYPTPNVANGLSFSVNNGVKLPMSLKNIFTEISENFNAIPPINGDLLYWANQGVLLLNSILTVRAHQPGSHKNKGWEKFTDAIIKQISEEKKNVVFMFWGSYAKKKGSKVDKIKHLVLESGHPSPLSANRGLWFGNKHFKKCNDYLKLHEQITIKWLSN